MKKRLIGLIVVYIAVAGLLVAQKPEETTAFKSCKQAIYDKDWQKAQTALNDFLKRFKSGSYMDEALYWLGYSLNQSGEGSGANRVKAIDALNELLGKYGKSKWIQEAKMLRIEIAQALVKNGHAEYQKYIENGVKTNGEGEDIKLMALDALLNMDSERAMPLLKKILNENRSAEMRAKAVFIISQHENAEVIPLLVNAAQKDPDQKVKEQAIFWISQQDSKQSQAALNALIDLYHNQGFNNTLKEKIIFGISEVGGEKSLNFLADIARREENQDMKEKAIFWISQQEGEHVLDILNDLYKQATTAATKKKIIFAFSQLDHDKGLKKLYELARTEKDEEAQGEAAFWIGQTDTAAAIQMLSDLYRDSASLKIKEKIIAAIAQNDDKKAVSTLIQIARSEKNNELRKKAVFWLSQTNSDEAINYLKELIEKD